MVTAGDFRKGVTFEKDGQPCLIVDFQHVKPGKGAAFVRTKYKNLKTGAIREEAFNPSDKFPKAHIDTRQMQYLYNDGELYYFMDNETFEQIPLDYEKVEDAIKFLKENDTTPEIQEVQIRENLHINISFNTIYLTILSVIPQYHWIFLLSPPSQSMPSWCLRQ